MSKEVEQWKHEYDVLNACCELAQGKIAELKQDIEAYKRSEQEASEIIAELKAELQKYKDMEAKGLEEFKDVGGCWGCGLQLQLNQDLEDIKQLKAENEKLREDYIKLSQQKDLDNARWQKRCTDLHIEDKVKADKYWLVLQEIKKYIAKICKEECGYVQKKRCPDCDCRFGAILDLITKAEEE